MTPKQIAVILLKYIGVTNLDPNANQNSLNVRGLGTTDLDDVATCITAAMQELHGLAPGVLFQRRKGFQLYPPTGVSVNCTQYSTAFTISGFQNWMEGCTIRITGDDTDNRIMSQTEILRPFQGGTGSNIPATVFCDCIPMPSTVLTVVEPIEIPDYAKLSLLGSQEQFRFWNDPLVYVTDRHPLAPLQYQMRNKLTNIPQAAYVDAIYDPASAFTPIYLQLNPMPGQAMTLTCTLRYKPPIFTSTDIDPGDHTTDPETIIPLDQLQTLLLPICLQKWTSHPNFLGDKMQAAEIMRAYQRAIDSLQDKQPVTGPTLANYLP